MSTDDASPLTLEDFEAAGWRKTIENAREKNCLHYAEQFRQKVIEAETAGDSVGTRVYRLLMDVAFMMLDPHSVDQPFGARVSCTDGRSAIPDDFTLCDLALFNRLALSVDDPEMRARLADLAWMLTRHYGAAELAINSYLESAKRLEDPKLPLNSVHRTERALRLAMQLGNRDLISKVLGQIEAILDRHRGEFQFRLVSEFLGVLGEFRLGDAAKYASFADEYATKAESRNDFDTAGDFWRLKAKWFDSRSAEHRSALIAAAETYVKKADLLAAGTPPNLLIVEALLESAIQAHRSIPGQRERVVELHQRLLEIQPVAAAQMPRMEMGEIDISESIHWATLRVRGKSFFEALVAIATFRKADRTQDLARACDREHEVRTDCLGAGEGLQERFRQDGSEDAIEVFRR